MSRRVGDGADGGDGVGGGPTHVVGQETESARLEAALADAAAGAPTVVVLEGVPGVGRTTLLRRFLARRPGLAVVQAGGLAWEAGRPGALVRRLDPLRCTGSVDPGAWGEALAACWWARAAEAPLAVV